MSRGEGNRQNCFIKGEYTFIKWRQRLIFWKKLRSKKEARRSQAKLWQQLERQRHEEDRYGFRFSFREKYQEGKINRKNRKSRNFNRQVWLCFCIIFHLMIAMILCFLRFLCYLSIAWYALCLIFNANCKTMIPRYLHELYVNLIIEQ